MVDDQICNIVDVGRARIEMNDSSAIILLDLRHVLEIKKNLISLDTLDGLGYKYMA